MQMILIATAMLGAATSVGAEIHDSAALRKAVYESFSPEAFSITGRISFVRMGASGRPSAVAAEDSSGGIILYPAEDMDWDGTPRLGDLAAFSGRINLDRGKKPCALVDRHVRIAGGNPEPPIDARAADLLDGRYDFRRTRFSGTLRDVTVSETNPSWTMLVIYDARSRMFASVPATAGESAALKGMIGERVTVTGFCVPDDLSPRFRIGRIFMVASSADVCSTASERTAVEDLPEVARIRYGIASDVEALGPHRATGGVVAVRRNRRAVIHTADDDFVGVEFADGPMPRYGDVVTVWGLPESDLFHIHLTNAKWRKSNGAFVDGAASHAKPRAIFVSRNGNPEVDSHLHGRVLHFEGIVRSVSSEGPDDRLVHVESDGVLVAVDATSLPDVFAQVEIGSRVSVTGICVMELETLRSPTAFPKIGHLSLVLRKPGDLVVISRPPWWTAGRLCAVIGALAAALVAIFIWNVTLRKLADRKGRELMRTKLRQEKAVLKTEERTRLAVELHDSVAQMLTGISMEIEAARGFGEESSPKMLAHIDIAGKALKSCRDELRNCLWDLRSKALEETDMTKAVLRTLQPHVNDSRLSVKLDVPRAALSDNTAHVLLRIVRELVSNALRHSGATRIEVSGRLDGDCITCSVADNGRGFDPDACPGVTQGHFGLTGVRERLDQLHGRMAIESSPGAGTTITISIPKTEDTK